MEALEFLKEARRMCLAVGSCDECHLSYGCVVDDVKKVSDSVLESNCSVVEAWSKEHPIITNAMKFKEVFGFMPAGCQTFYFVEPNGSYSKTINWQDPYKEPKEVKYGDGKPEWCPIGDVPTPHGRLIDADELQRQ